MPRLIRRHVLPGMPMLVRLGVRRVTYRFRSAVKSASDQGEVCARDVGRHPIAGSLDRVGRAGCNEPGPFPERYLDGGTPGSLLMAFPGTGNKGVARNLVHALTGSV